LYDIISPFCLAIREITIYTGNFSVPFLKESICSFFLDKLHLQLFVDRRQIRQVREMLAPQQKHKLHAPSLWYPARMLLTRNQPTYLAWMEAKAKNMSFVQLANSLFSRWMDHYPVWHMHRCHVLLHLTPKSHKLLAQQQIPNEWKP